MSGGEGGGRRGQGGVGGVGAGVAITLRSEQSFDDGRPWDPSTTVDQATPRRWLPWRPLDGLH